MIVLACTFCTGYESLKVLTNQTIINQVLKSQCFTETMVAVGVSEKDADKVSSVKGKFEIKFYREDSNVVGFMYPGKTDIYLNRKFHDKFNYCKSSSNISHELAHMHGFRHFVDVAYATNYAFEYCCEDQ